MTELNSLTLKSRTRESHDCNRTATFKLGFFCGFPSPNFVLDKSLPTNKMRLIINTLHVIKAVITTTRGKDFYRQLESNIAITVQKAMLTINIADCVINYQPKGQGKSFPYSIPSAGPGADSGVQAVSPQATVSHPPGSRLPLLSARPAVTSPASEHHCPLARTKLYCMVTEAHRCKQLA